MKCETNPNNCPIEVTLSLIGGKYKPVILWFLIDHPLHYAELQRLIPKATPKMLSQQLHDLENSGIIHREVIPENGDPIYVYDKKIYTCCHGTRKIKDELMAENFAAFLDLID